MFLWRIGKAKDCREAERKRSLIRTNGAKQQFKGFCLSRNTAAMSSISKPIPSRLRTRPAFPSSQENWAIFKNVHEPIIARDDFEKVQTLIAKTKRRAPKPTNGEKSIFCDLLYCGDCHKKLRHHTNTINKDIHYFVCANNKVDYRGSCPGRHYVRADAVEQVVMLELRRMAEFLHETNKPLPIFWPKDRCRADEGKETE